MLYKQAHCQWFVTYWKEKYYLYLWTVLKNKASDPLKIFLILL